jgi:hypothetical protein
VFFTEPTVDALAAAMAAFERAADRFHPRALRARAARFDRPRFASQVRAYVDARWRAFAGQRSC